MAPTRRILITGGTGFVGSHVAALLADGPDAANAPRLRLLVHHRPTTPDDTGRVEVRRGSLTDPRSLRGVCDGVDTVLHLASLIGGSPADCAAVNDAGTGALLEEAARAGVERIVQLGTTAVYRDEPHTGAREGEPVLGPSSPTSVSRLAGEERVLAAGGVVLRPHLVYGPGDVWVVPALVDFLTAFPRWIDGGRARTSLIGVHDLARAVAALSLRPELPRGQVLHAARPDPVPVRDLVGAVCRELRLPLPEGEVSLARAAALTGADRDPLVRRRLSLLAVDHWYDSSRLWQLLDMAPLDDFARDFAVGAAWYRSLLSRRTDGELFSTR
ncbi:NAD(P)-dependent oxidoreductase [Streptomyces sp. GXMU-J15]|uniref:NAD(P)-dependent oxidoreductase n=1 Tax=Streptomyces fuscus TaxID=3048495 RepID=A0ABT7J1N6_9ACTN|nr:NAD(P)-dependent oxidoreductase [Streptomyces fuscus]MDL2078759.1 NAD(P)-dependent oxidoreductase [Streptomyces fuscus]